MATALIPIPQTDRRSVPRALVCASAVVVSKGKATEHMTYDLSVGGVRLCGLPRAQVGDKVLVRLQLPRARICARGYIVRVGSPAENLDFAIQFVDLASRDEDAIQSAVVEALSHPDRCSVLLVQREEERYGPPGVDWLDPISPICATARTSFEAVEYLEEHPFDVGIVGSGGHGTLDSEWIEMYPEVCWRSIDHAGRLHPVVTLAI